MAMIDMFGIRKLCILSISSILSIIVLFLHVFCNAFAYGVPLWEEMEINPQTNAITLIMPFILDGNSNKRYFGWITDDGDKSMGSDLKAVASYYGFKGFCQAIEGRSSFLGLSTTTLVAYRDNVIQEFQGNRIINRIVCYDYFLSHGDVLASYRSLAQMVLNRDYLRIHRYIESQSGLRGVINYPSDDRPNALLSLALTMWSNSVSNVQMDLSLKIIALLIYSGLDLKTIPDITKYFDAHVQRTVSGAQKSNFSLLESAVWALRESFPLEEKIMGVLLVSDIVAHPSMTKSCLYGNNSCKKEFFRNYLALIEKEIKQIAELGRDGARERTEIEIEIERAEIASSLLSFLSGVKKYFR
ncbi:MAG: hypothetical protein HQK53_10820 [Oligoflexia bacterium]|nr:hypothetical protein [Oligoflexia bacterium]